MQKFRRLSDMTRPEKTEIGGQKHMLAYITPQEASALRQMGGGGFSGEQLQGPGGTPAFYGGVGGPGADGPGASSPGVGAPGRGTPMGFGDNSATATGVAGVAPGEAATNAQSRNVTNQLSQVADSGVTDFGGSFSVSPTGQVSSHSLGQSVASMGINAMPSMVGSLIGGPVGAGIGASVDPGVDIGTDVSTGVTSMNANPSIDPVSGVATAVGQAAGVPGMGTMAGMMGEATGPASPGQGGGRGGEALRVAETDQSPARVGSVRTEFERENADLFGGESPDLTGLPTLEGLVSRYG